MRLASLFIPLLLVLFVVNSLTHTRQLPYDAMNYVDVARHVTQGDGLVQTTVGVFQPRLATLPHTGPVPFVAQAPLFPLLVVAFHALGASFQDAALLLSALGYLLTLGLGLLVLIGYAGLLLAVGRYYSGRNTTAEDFLLGGRRPPALRRRKRSTRLADL